MQVPVPGRTSHKRGLVPKLLKRNMLLYESCSFGGVTLCYNFS